MFPPALLSGYSLLTVFIFLKCHFICFMFIIKIVLASLQNKISGKSRTKYTVSV